MLFCRPMLLLVSLVALLVCHERALGQSRPGRDRNEARKAVADPQEKPDPRESKVAGEQAADSPEDEGEKKADKDSKEAKEKANEPVVTHGTVTIDGREVAYTATAGKMTMKTDDGTPKADVFYIAYTLDDEAEVRSEQGDDRSSAESVEEEDAEDEDEADQDEEEDDDQDEDEDDAEDVSGGDDAERDSAGRRAPRPVTFCFNGGPGSSSVWLHLGMLGPVRVKLGSDAEILPPPHELIPNEFSLLDVTDLVFIDPVSTGFSRPAKGEDKRQFHGYDEDLRSVGQFIHDYTTRYGRWSSPKFLLGESYGGLRAAGLCGELQDRYHMYLNGVVLVSAVVDFQTLSGSGNNDVAHALFLPTYAATAWYHKALSEELQELPLEELQREAERFALGPYLRALTAGDSLDEQRRAEVVQRMAELTGLSADYVEAANLRVPMHRFGQELLRDRGQVIGRFDSRYANHALDPVGESTDYDPSATAVFGTFTSALNEYLRETLKVEDDRVYEILTDRVHPWDYSEFANRFVNASTTLRRAMVHNPYLQVFAACGYYDLATPLFAMKHTRNHLNLPQEVRKNFTMQYYEAGHMMYAHEPSLAKLRTDLLKFYQSALEPLRKPQGD